MDYTCCKSALNALLPITLQFNRRRGCPALVVRQLEQFASLDFAVDLGAVMDDERRVSMLIMDALKNVLIRGNHHAATELALLASDPKIGMRFLHHDAGVVDTEPFAFFEVLAVLLHQDAATEVEVLLLLVFRTELLRRVRLLLPRGTSRRSKVLHLHLA